MKECTLCHKNLNESEFYARTNRKCLYAFCKKCFTRYNSEKHIRKKAKAITYLGGKCADCKIIMSDEYPYYLFDFHHIDPTEKEHNWSQLRFRSWDKIKIELDKCVCLCALCHRRREYHEGRLMI